MREKSCRVSVPVKTIIPCRNGELKSRDDIIQCSRMHSVITNLFNIEVTAIVIDNHLLISANARFPLDNPSKSVISVVHTVNRC